MDKFLGMPVDASTHGYQIDSLMGWLHWLMLILFVGWAIYFVYTLVRFRASRNQKANYEGAKTRVSTYVEVGVALIEGVLLVGLSIPIWANVVDGIPDKKDAVEIRVVAEQFAWNFHYTGPDGKFGRVASEFVDTVTNPVGLDPNDPNGADDITTINQMYVPTGKPVITRISSKDVIHSFGVPALRVKQDAIPGMETPIWFEAKKTGSYEIACSQLCGVGHYSMRAFVQIKEPAEFDAWLAEQQKAKQEQGSGDDFWD